MIAVDIDKKLETFAKLIQEFGLGTYPLKEVLQRQNEIAENFKAAQFPDAETKEAANEKFQQLIQLLKEKENEVDAANLQFTEEAERLVTVLDALYKKHTEENSLDKNAFQEIRTIANQTFEYFKAPRWATKERRVLAWDKYSEIRNAIKDKEDELYTKVRDERNKQVTQSLEITEKLSVVVNACHPSVAIEELLQFVNRFNQFLQDSGLTEHNKPWFLMEKPDEIKYTLRARTETLNDIRNFIGNYKDFITREHKGQIFANIDSLKEDLNKAWETHKEEQVKRQQEWEVKKKERDEKRVEWVKNQQNFLTMLEKRFENQTEYKDKQIKYLQSQKEYIGRFENRILQQKDYIVLLNEQLVELEKKHATAWTDSFRVKVEEWMQEKNKKIAAVVKDIDVLKEKIVDINKNVEELPNKIQELDQSILEIKSKMEEVRQKLANDSVVIEQVVEQVAVAEVPVLEVVNIAQEESENTQNEAIIIQQEEANVSDANMNFPHDEVIYQKETQIAEHQTGNN